MSATSIDPAETAPATPRPPTGRRVPRGETLGRTLARYSVRPLALALVCLGLYLYVRGQELDSIERRVLTSGFIRERLIEHIELAAASTALVIAVAVPLGILVTRPFGRRLSPLVLTLGNIGLGVPTLGLLVLFAIWFGIGFRFAVLALVAYSVLPVLRNTMVGLQQVDAAVIEAGRGMGLTRLGVLLRIELPLAVPVILAGISTALVLNVGSATLAAFVDAGGLGRLIDAGLRLDRDPVLITGGVLTAVLALLVDWLAGVVEAVLRPRGL